MSVLQLEITDENIIKWIENKGYFMYIPELIWNNVIEVKVNVKIDTSYNKIYSNISLLEYIDNTILIHGINKVPIHWDNNNEKYFIIIKNVNQEYKIYVNIFIDILSVNNKNILEPF